MTEHDEVDAFLRRTARAHEAVEPVSVAEASHRPAPRSRWTSTWTGDRRTPAIAVAVLLALLVGSLGGYAVGRSSAPKKQALSTHAPGQVPSVPASTVVGSEAAAGAAPMTSIFRRKTGDGVTIRAFLQPLATSNATACASGTPACPTTTCTSSQLVMELSNDEAVAQGYALSQGNVAVQGHAVPTDLGGFPAVERAFMSFGVVEGGPATVVAVETDATVDEIVATWSDGVVDRMTPVSGWAVVAHRGEEGPRVQYVSGGQSADVAPLTPSAVPVCVEPSPETTVPATLPPAGEQPADAPAAVDAVKTAYSVVFSHATDKAARRPYIEDVDGLQSTFDQLNAKYPEPTQTVTVDIGEIRFTSPTSAALFFTLNYTGGATFGQQIGHATLIDGTWKVSRDTMCMVVGFAGISCPAASGGSGGSAPATVAPAPTTN